MGGPSQRTKPEKPKSAASITKIDVCQLSENAQNKEFNHGWTRMNADSPSSPQKPLNTNSTGEIIFGTFKVSSNEKL
jgi:hypothetical protein